MEDGGKDTATMTEIHREGVYHGVQKYGLTVMHVQKHGIAMVRIQKKHSITLVCTQKALILWYLWYFVSVIVCDISLTQSSVRICVDVHVL